MPKISRTLTELQVKAIKRPGLHAVSERLFLKIDKRPDGSIGSRSWIVRVHINGQPTKHGLGPVREVSLAEAREKAREIVEAAKNGVNVRNAVVPTMPTFGDVSRALISQLEAKFRSPKHAAQWRTTLTTYAGTLTNRPVDSIRTDDVVTLLQPIWTEKAETASRVRQRISKVFKAAIARGLRTDNPAEHIEMILGASTRVAKRKHFTAMPYTEIHDFIQKLRSQAGTGARALEFAILTAARTNEVIGIKTNEITSDTWTIPAARMKANREHIVPLVPRALDLLDECGGTFAISTATMAAVLKRMDISVTVHGFRATFKTWATESRHDRDVVEFALAHVNKDRVESAYTRTTLLESRRQLMIDWQNFIETKPAEKVDNVVPIRAVREQYRPE